MLQVKSETIEYGTPNWFAQTDVGPVIETGVEGVPLTVKFRGALLPHALFAVTVTVPEINTGNAILADAPLGVTTEPATLVDHE